MGIQIFHTPACRSSWTPSARDQESLSPEAAARLQPVIAQANSPRGRVLLGPADEDPERAEDGQHGNDIYEAGVPADRRSTTCARPAMKRCATPAPHQRASDLAFRRDWTGGLSALALALAIALSWLITHSLARPLTQRHRRVRPHLRRPLRQPDRVRTARMRPARCCSPWMRCRASCATRSRPSARWRRRIPASARPSTRLHQRRARGRPSSDRLPERCRASELHAQPAGDPQDPADLRRRAAARLDARCAVHPPGAGAPPARHPARLPTFRSACSASSPSRPSPTRCSMSAASGSER